MAPTVGFRKKAFGAYLRRVREHTRSADGKRMARQTLAAAADVAPSTIQAAEDGEKVPGVDTLARMLEPLGITLGAFFAGFDADLLPGLREVSENDTTVPHRTTPPVQEAQTVHGPGSLPATDLAGRPIVIHATAEQLQEIIHLTIKQNAARARVRQAAAPHAGKSAGGRPRAKRAR